MDACNVEYYSIKKLKIPDVDGSVEVVKISTDDFLKLKGEHPNSEALNVIEECKDVQFVHHPDFGDWRFSTDDKEILDFIGLNRDMYLKKLEDAESKAEQAQRDAVEWVDEFRDMTLWCRLKFLFTKRV